MAQDPDAAVVATFKYLAIKNDAKSLSEGRPIFDDVEVVELRFPGKRDFSVHHATAMSHWRDDPMTGEQTMVTYAERFSHQYRQFRQSMQQTKSGTPTSHAPFLTEARRAELRALNIYTVEALAMVEGQELKNLGYAGRELKNKAQEYIEGAKRSAPDMQLMAEIEQMRAKMSVLEEDNKALKESRSEPEDEFSGMSSEQLRDYITAQTGTAPHGNSNRKTLVRMAQEARPDAKVA